MAEAAPATLKEMLKGLPSVNGKEVRIYGKGKCTIRIKDLLNKPVGRVKIKQKSYKSNYNYNKTVKG